MQQITPVKPRKPTILPMISTQNMQNVKIEQFMLSSTEYLPWLESLPKSFAKSQLPSRAVVAHAFNLSIREAEAGGSLCG